MCVSTCSSQQGALPVVSGCVYRWQDEGLRGLQGIFEGIQRGNENGGPILLSAAGAPVAMFGCQAREAGDGVEVGLMGAEPGEGAERGQRRQHWEPRQSRVVVSI